MSTTAWAGRKQERPAEVRLLISLIASDEKARARAVQMLSRRFGPINYYSHPLDFDFTDYYGPEMGSGLTRRIAAFDQPVGPERLAVIKRICMSLERDLSVRGKRVVNIDPGLLGDDALVLATGKPAGHRLCLDQGIYGEVTLLYRSGDFQGLPWTYRDWTEPEIKEVLHKIRSRFQWQRKQNSPKEG